jgi:hypothetical protein
VRRLMRYEQGARDGWRVGPGPAVEAEAGRPRPRAWATLKQERARTTPRLQGWRGRQGVRRSRVRPVPAPLDEGRLGEGAPIPDGLRRRCLRVWAPHALLRQQMAAGEATRRERLPTAQEARLAKGRPLRCRTGLGRTGAWGLVRACLAWRAFPHRREGGGGAGVTPTPSPSGERAREPGMTQSGKRQGRWRTTAWAWRGGRSQPARALRGWGRERGGGGGKRWRRLGLGAVARP